MRGAAFLLCATLAAQSLTPREETKRRMAAHPDEPWPPMRGHVVLAQPGSPLEQKGYHELGAWFSPAPGSFGIVVLPQLAPKQRLEDGAIVTETDEWVARWLVEGDCAYTLTVEPRSKGVRLRIQSAGPAGGPLYEIRQDGGGLLLNGQWRIAPAIAASGGEGNWLFAEFGVPVKSSFSLRKTTPCVPSSLRRLGGVKVSLPDRRFVDCLAAQVSHLTMGLTGEETRPGEPVNYPLAWLRDGTYSLAALARAGQLDTSRKLARLFAERDFFGGFGPEADAPGLALWSLEEVASRLRDTEFDRFLWPHAWRKAEWIVRMRHTTVPLRAVVFGPIVPRHMKDPNLDLVCEPARDGLIIGRMDHHRPLLFVNAVSYAGLRAAAELADRMGVPEDAKRWRHEAAQLREAWWRAFDTRERDNERTAIVGLWPSWIAADNPARYRQTLEERWKKTRTADGGFLKTPLWTYFEIAQAHNWLLTGDREKAWQTLEWFWANQASPGLYTWWEGEGEENSFGLWQQIRGWVNPPHITPHYWTASEMLHLQLDMLAFVDESKDPAELVIGAGVPDGLLKEPMRVEELPTRLGVAGWRWDGKRLAVTLDGRPARYRPGAAFARQSAR